MEPKSATRRMGRARGRMGRVRRRMGLAGGRMGHGARVTDGGRSQGGGVSSSRGGGVGSSVAVGGGGLDMEFFPQQMEEGLVQVKEELQDANGMTMEGRLKLSPRFLSQEIELERMWYYLLEMDLEIQERIAKLVETSAELSHMTDLVLEEVDKMWPFPV